MTDADAPSAPPDATGARDREIRALEREHEEVQALLRDEIQPFRDVLALRFEEIAVLTSRLEEATAARALDAALSRWRLRLGTGGPPSGLPSPRAQGRALVDSPLFDAAFYRAALGHALPRLVSPERHYVTAGAFEGLDPGPGFSTRGYYALNPDVLAAGWPALSHYVLHGAAEGRPVTGAAEGRPVTGAVEDRPVTGAAESSPARSGAEGQGSDPASDDAPRAARSAPGPRASGPVGGDGPADG